MAKPNLTPPAPQAPNTAAARPPAEHSDRGSEGGASREPRQECGSRQNNTVLLELPFGPLGPGYISNRVDAHLTPKQAENLRRIAAGLEERGARLESGTLVNDGPKAVRWMLEQIVAPE